MNNFSSGNASQTDLSQRPPRNLAVERLQIASPALAVASVFLLASILQAILHGVFSIYFPDLTDAPWYRQVISMMPMYAFAMPFSLLLFAMSKSEPPQKQRMHPAVWLGLLTVCFLLTYVGNLLGTLVNELFSSMMGKPAVN